MEYKMIHDFIVFDDGRVYKPAIKPSKKHRDYLTVSHNGDKFLVHRLIAEAYIPNPDNKPYVNHIDGNSNNNAASNLEWVTASENVAHAWSTGLIPRRHLTERHLKSGYYRRTIKSSNNIKKVRREKGITQAALANATNLSQPFIHDLVKGNRGAKRETLNKIAAALECNVSDLIEDREE
jgi:DNA-binding Xre family transcriptional regulator